MLGWCAMKNEKYCLIHVDEKCILLKTVSFMIIEKSFFKWLFTAFFHINLIVSTVCFVRKQKKSINKNTFAFSSYRVFVFLFLMIFYILFYTKNFNTDDWGTHIEISTHKMDRYRLSKLIVHIEIYFEKIMSCAWAY